MNGLGGGKREMELTTTTDGDKSLDESEDLNFVVTGKQLVPLELPTSCKLESQQVRIPKVFLAVDLGGGANSSTEAEAQSTPVSTNCVEVDNKFKSEGRPRDVYSQLMQEEEMVDITEDFSEAVKCR